MSYSLKFDYPNLGSQSVQVPGLGEFENGKTHEVSDEQIVEWRARNFMLLEVTDKTNQPTGEYRRKEGPSLTEYFAHTEYVTVVEPKATKSAASVPTEAVAVDAGEEEAK